VTTVSTYAYVNPVVAVLAGIVFLGEQFTWREGLGAALVLASVVITLHRSRGASHPGPKEHRVLALHRLDDTAAPGLGDGLRHRIGEDVLFAVLHSVEDGARPSPASSAPGNGCSHGTSRLVRPVKSSLTVIRLPQLARANASPALALYIDPPPSAKSPSAWEVACSGVPGHARGHGLATG
jgi:hypothetical protein